MKTLALVAALAFVRCLSRSQLPPVVAPSNNLMPRRGGTPNFALPRPAPKRLTAVGMVQLGLMQLTGACGTTGARERLAASTSAVFAGRVFC